MYRWIPAAAVVIAGSVTTSANALELSGGVSAGGLLVGGTPRLAVSPHAGVSWRTEGGFLLLVQDALRVIPAVDRHGVGVYNQTTGALGYAWKAGRFSVGPSLSVFTMPMCGVGWCAPTAGMAAGGQARVDFFFAGSLGVSATLSFEWLNTPVVPGGVAAIAAVGPVLKWGDR